MYPMDRRKQAGFIYKILNSLRKTAIMLQVSHSTISRWLTESRKEYNNTKRTVFSKSEQIVSSIKIMIQNDPFVSLNLLTLKIKDLFMFTVSKELIRTIIKKNGISKKKARFFSSTAKLPELTKVFIEKRNQYIEEGKEFVSLDETSFGRHGRLTKGYAPVGKHLIIRKRFPRITTISSLVAINQSRLLKKQETIGSFNKIKFLAFLECLDLPKNTVVLLDNVSFHHSKEVKSFAATKQWILLYVPPYSPWFNPIEGVFSIVKREYYKSGDAKECWSSLETTHVQAFFKKSLEIECNPLIS